MLFRTETVKYNPDAKKVVITLGKRKTIVSFVSEPSLHDKSVLIKERSEGFQDRLEEDRCEIVLQMKNAEVKDFIEVEDRRSYA